MRHLTDIDAQLGLSPYDNFSDADGRGAAKAALAAGLAACSLKHPFNKSKREACRKEKLELYTAKIKAIDGVKGETSKAQQEIDAIAGIVNSVTTKKPVNFSKDLPQSPRMPESPAESRATQQAAQEAEAAAAAAAAAESGMSMNTKILIGVGAAVLLIGGYMYMKRKK